MKEKIQNLVNSITKDKRMLGIILGVTIVLIIVIIFLLVKENDKELNNNEMDQALVGIYPNGTELVEINLGTYYNGVQKDYCKIKLPGNYYGWAMYLASDNTNQNFEMATSHFLSDSVNSGILDKEEAIQQFHYNNSQSVEENTTNLYATIFTKDQITYDGMKNQISGATKIKELGDNAFYSKGDKAYTDIDFTMYYKLTDDITLQLSYQGPLADSAGIKKVANELYKLIEVIE